MKDSGCAFKVVDADGVRYYTSPEVLGLADFARSLHENERDGGGSPCRWPGGSPGRWNARRRRGWPWRMTRRQKKGFHAS